MRMENDHGSWMSFFLGVLVLEKNVHNLHTKTNKQKDLECPMKAGFFRLHLCSETKDSRMLKLYTVSSLILLPYDFFPPQGLNISSPPPGFDVRRVDKVGGRPLPPLLVVGPTREGTWDPQKLNFFLGTNFFFGIFEKFVPKVPKVAFRPNLGGKNFRPSCLCRSPVPWVPLC